MTWPQNCDPPHNVALFTASSSTASRWRRWWAFGFVTGTGLRVSVHQNYGEIIPSWLRQLPQRFLQFGEPVDLRYGTLQRPHRGGDVPEEMFVTLDQAEKSVST
jgi:hypothetical protein